MIDIPSHLSLFPTIAMQRGDTAVHQCAQCGLLCVATTARKLGLCPSCGGGEWWRQEFPVGPFRKGDEECAA
jgi:hypothetical protein